MTGAATLLDERYLLDEEIGAGGFCAVWRATDTVLTRPVAVKLLHPGFAGHPEARARFKDEARHAGALSHENVARVYDYGESARGQSYLVMELIEGPSLAEVLADGPLDAARTMDIVAQVAAGLQAAHSAGLVHRDIKPSNILVAPDGTARITDFGVARAVDSVPITATGMVVGSPGYIAPERVSGAQAGPASDLYALGIVAFECLAGARPFQGPPLEVAIAHRDRPLPRLPAWVPPEVAAFVMLLTAKDPYWRPASAGEVAWQAGRLRDDLFAGAFSDVACDAGAEAASGAGAGAGAGAARPGTAAPAADSVTRSDRRPAARTRAPASRRLRALGAAVTAVAALTCLCLALLTVAGMASASHQAASSDTARTTVATPAASPTPTGSPAAAKPAATRPAATPSARAVAAVTHAPAADPAVRPYAPYPPGRQGHPGRGNGPGPGRGNGPGPGRGHGRP